MDAGDRDESARILKGLIQRSLDARPDAPGDAASAPMIPEPLPVPAASEPVAPSQVPPPTAPGTQPQWQPF
jgi:hypothetical protein